MFCCRGSFPRWTPTPTVMAKGAPAATGAAGRPRRRRRRRREPGQGLPSPAPSQGLSCGALLGMVQAWCRPFPVFREGGGLIFGGGRALSLCRQVKLLLPNFVNLGKQPSAEVSCTVLWACGFHSLPLSTYSYFAGIGLCTTQEAPRRAQFHAKTARSAVIGQMPNSCQCRLGAQSQQLLPLIAAGAHRLRAG